MDHQRPVSRLGVALLGLMLCGCGSSAPSAPRTSAPPVATPTVTTTITATQKVPSALPSLVPTLEPTPAPVLPSTPAASAPGAKQTTATGAGNCSIRSNAGNCYHAGEICRERDLGQTTTDAEGKEITCSEEAGARRWHY